MDSFPSHANLSYLPQRTFLTDTQVEIWEKRHQCGLQQTEDVGHAMTEKIGFGDIKGKKVCPRQANMN